MPAYFDTGFSVREPMWHGQGIVLDDYPVDWTDARKKAGLEWEPASRPIFQLNQAAAICWQCRAQLNELHTEQCSVDGPRHVTPDSVSEDALRSSIIELPDQKLIVRDDNEHVLGVVGQGYELVDHAEMGGILESILGLEHVKFETAGSCRDGAQVWALAYLDEPYTVAGDVTETYPFLALLNSHDGSGACKVVATQVRVVCWNTYRAAEMQGERTGRQFVFSHTAGIHDRIEEAKQALSGVRDEAKEWDALASELFGLKVDDEQLSEFLAAFLPEPIGEVASKRVHSNVEKARKVFRTLYLDSPTTEGHRGTALGLIDASVEYLDHVRGFRNSDTLMGRTLLKPEPLKARALTLVRELVHA